MVHNAIQWFKQLFTKQSIKSIAFLDGDQPLPGILAAYEKHLQGIETHLIRLHPDTHKEPKILRKQYTINKIYLSGYSASKEVVDKFIGAYVQKAVDDAYTHITVVSSDYDFIDIFKMAVVLNPVATNVTFRLIVPFAKGRLTELESDKLLNIEVVKM